MRRVVIADTSCLIILSKIEELGLLPSLYNEIVITPEVANEFRLDLPEGFIIEAPQLQETQKILHLNLDVGEASSIALCLEHEESLLIIDEKRGRKIARQLGLEITGTLGVILAAKEAGLVSEVKPILNSIREKTDFRLSDSLVARLLELAEE